MGLENGCQGGIMGPVIAVRAADLLGILRWEKHKAQQEMLKGA